MTLAEHMQMDYDLKMEEPPERLNEEQRELWEDAYGPKRQAFEKEKPEGKDLIQPLPQ